MMRGPFCFEFGRKPLTRQLAQVPRRSGHTRPSCIPRRGTWTNPNEVAIREFKTTTIEVDLSRTSRGSLLREA